MKAPGSLWLFPIFFGVFGGITAALIANMKYEACWWQYVIAGLLITSLPVIAWLLFIGILIYPL